jgi:alpha-tubulin suppressor-like RCC1 family protein
VKGCLFKVKIKDIACGWQHSMAVTASGLLFTWGLNVYG